MHLAGSDFLFSRESHVAEGDTFLFQHCVRFFFSHCLREANTAIITLTLPLEDSTKVGTTSAWMILELYVLSGFAKFRRQTRASGKSMRKMWIALSDLEAALTKKTK